ncbi:MAG TPA: hypothetical protein VHD31_02705 [Candidatus Paceibacterota bacterium]|nr:hypothetical protein [Candidatus Paceibacterota bacterium]
MINPQLLEYVRAQRAAGLSKDAITQALAQGGWSSQDANEAFMAIEGVKTPPPAPAAPGPVAPRVLTPPTAVPGTAINPVTPAAQAPMGGQIPTAASMAPLTPRPMMAASELKTAPVAVRHTGRWILILAVLLLLLGVGGVGAWVYMNPSVISSYLPGNSENTMPTYVPSDTPEAPIMPTESTTTATSTATTTPGTTASTSVSVTATTTVH